MGLMCVFVCRLIQHTKALMSAEEKLCIKVLRILQEMLIRTLDFDEKVSSNSTASFQPKSSCSISEENSCGIRSRLKNTPQNPDLFR